MSKYFTVIVSFLVAMLATAGAFLSFRMPAASVGKAITRSMATSASPKEQAEKAIKENDIMVFSKTYCPYCSKAKAAIAELNYKFGVIELDTISDGDAIQKSLLDLTGQRTVPNIFVKGQHIGGCDKTLEAIAAGRFQKLVQG